MAIVGLVTDKDPKAVDCFRKIIDKSKAEKGIAKNPFNIKHKIKLGSEDLFFLLDIEPVYPPVYLYGLIILFVVLVFKWFNWFLLLPLCLLGLGFFWSPPFYYIMLFFSLKKNGYKGKIKVLSLKKIIRRLL